MATTPWDPATACSASTPASPPASRGPRASWPPAPTTGSPSTTIQAHRRAPSTTRTTRTRVVSRPARSTREGTASWWAGSTSTESSPTPPRPAPGKPPRTSASPTSTPSRRWLGSPTARASPWEPSAASPTCTTPASSACSTRAASSSPTCRRARSSSSASPRARASSCALRSAARLARWPSIATGSSSLTRPRPLWWATWKAASCPRWRGAAGQRAPASASCSSTPPCAPCTAPGSSLSSSTARTSCLAPASRST
mmetsp:Transcript_21865/g.83233  ORF Transcript_21865/g.83233 Transcript_21865/m.83233 type:complete len:256 (+) Transcript_21865:579-1346(+)